MQLSDQAIEAYSKLTLADCARVDCALAIRTVSHLHNAALNAPGGVPEEFDAIHAAFNSITHGERNHAFKKGKEEYAERRRAIEGQEQWRHQVAKESKIQNAINNKPIKKLADVLTAKQAEEIQYEFVIGRIASGRQHFSAEEIDQVVRDKHTNSGVLAINPVDREIGGSNVERWKQTTATARQNLKNDGYIMWSVRAQRWIIPLTEQDLKKEAKKRVENAPVRILQIKRTGT